MKIRNINGTVAEVDDELGKRLVAETNEWSSVRAPRTAKEPTNDK